MILKNTQHIISTTVALLIVGMLAIQPNNNGYPTPVIETVATTQDESAESTEKDVIVSQNTDTSDTPRHFNKTNASSPILVNRMPDAENNKSTYKPIRSPYVQEYVSDDVVYSDSGATYPSRIYKTQALPNDPAVNQWWVNSAELPNLWETNTGSSDTLLAIIDTGFALDHEEFQGRWYTNSNEVGVTVVQSVSKYNCSDQSIVLDQSCNLIDDNYDGIVDNESGATVDENSSQLNCSDQGVALDKSCNMIDDDGNGLVDDWRGWDFMSFDRSVQAGDVNPNGSGTKHASYVTGVAAANANNGVGIAGVNWQTKILPLQALGDNGSGTSISVARAIRYATAQGADVISMSLGGSYPDSFTRQAVQEAIEAGIIVVAASGNDGCDCISYPANYPEVLAVGALDTANKRASFSSYGANLDIVAPGTNLYTATWTPTNQTSAYAGGITGTSLATPIVSAAITSLISESPNASPLEILAALQENTNRLGMLVASPQSTTLGFGTLDAFAANNRLRTVSNPIQLDSFGPISLGSTFYSEPIASTRLFQCADDQHGSTAIYRLKKSSTEFYSASYAEIHKAQLQGYTSQLLAYACASQSQDTPQSIRVINVFSEFSNKLVK